MESYLQKLLTNQQQENAVRNEREQMLKRHERELEELDERINDLIKQRNEIIDDIQNFTKSSSFTNNYNNNNDSNDTSINDKQQQQQPKQQYQFRTSNESAFKPIRRSQTLDLNNNPIDDDNDGEQRQQADTKIPTTPPTSTAAAANPPPNKSSCSLRIKPRIRTTIIGGNTGSNVKLTRIPESPTTVQIESMLSKVRNNNSIDMNTLNKCIDLLSTPKNNAKTDVDELEKKEPVKTTAQSVPTTTTVTTTTAGEQSPTIKQPSSPKKRFETPEERRKRIERVLFEKPGNKMQKGAMSKSFSSLTIMENQLKQQQQQQQRSSNLSLNRFSQRSKIRRNHSLSPLRFGAKKLKNGNSGDQDDQSEPTSPITDNNSIATSVTSRDNFRKYKSEQQLYYDENISMASFDDDNNSTATSQNNDFSLDYDFNQDKLSLQIDDIDDINDDNIDDHLDDTHLLAPSKVMKSQDAFKQIFFPTDIREKPLMSKEELSKIKSKKTMVKSKSLGWTNDRRNLSNNDQASSLRVDHLSHIRHSSASPEQKMREKEINNLNNTKKFRCYQDFWENKTKEILEKKSRFNIKPILTPIKKLNDTFTSNASKMKNNWSSTTKTNNKTNDNQNTPTTAAGESGVDVKKIEKVSKIPEAEIVRKKSLITTNDNDDNKSINENKILKKSPASICIAIKTPSTATTTATIKQSPPIVTTNIMIDGQENVATFRPQSIRIIDTTKKQIKQPLTNLQIAKSRIEPLKIIDNKNITNNNTNNNIKEPQQSPQTNLTVSSPVVSPVISPKTPVQIITSTTTTTTNKQNHLNVLETDAQQQQKSPSPYSDTESEKLLEKLRYFQQDIRRHKMKQQIKQQQQQQKFLNNNAKLMPAKTLDLQYLNKHNQNKQQSLQQQQNNNRIKLVRSLSREDSTAPISSIEMKSTYF